RHPRRTAPGRQDHRVQEKAAAELPAQEWPSPASDRAADHRDPAGRAGRRSGAAASRESGKWHIKRQAVRPATAVTAPGGGSASRNSVARSCCRATSSCASAAQSFIPAIASAWAAITRFLRLKPAPCSSARDLAGAPISLSSPKTPMADRRRLPNNRSPTDGTRGERPVRSPFLFYGDR